jgi:Mrp family chromosome partitioning ATPase
MGRLIDALGQNRPAPALHAVWPEEGDNDVPFVEVGGPREPAAGVSPSAATPASSRPDAAPLWGVRFRPLPAGLHPAALPSRLAPELVAFHQPGHAVSDQYRDLVGTLLAQLPDPRAHVLLFTAATAGAGTTTVLLNAAVTLAREDGRRVVVVDAHLRRPAVAARLGLGETPGLREVLAGRLPTESAVRPTALPQLSALTAGAADASPVRLAGEAMRAILGQLRERFDMVLVDGPCWDGRPEVVALGCACDAVCLCLPEASQDAPETRELMQLIPEQGAALCGCVVTSC